MAYGTVLASVACAAALMAGVAQAACDPSQSGGGTRIYDGTLGAAGPIRMALAIGKESPAGGPVVGRYAFAESSADVPVDGALTDGGKRIRLTARDGAGKVSATFEGTFADHDAKYTEALNCEVITGTWTRDGGPASRLRLGESSSGGGGPEHLYGAAGVDNDELVDRAAQRFRRAVLDNKRTQVAAAVRYPVTVTVAKKPVKLRNAKALLAHYDQVFSKKFRAMIADDVPRLMFARDQGVMLGGGEIWFGPTGKVIAINN